VEVRLLQLSVLYLACDIASVREIAATQRLGGWQWVNKSTEYVSQLYNRAALIAAVRPGVVNDSYLQVSAYLLTYRTEISLRLAGSAFSPPNWASLVV